MTTIQVREDFDVVLVDVMGSDHRPLQAARTSTKGPESLETGQGEGLTRRLMRDRHGVPFEHASMQWLITAPIAVWREFHRHRIASYSEESARYRQLQPVFYVPPPERLLIQVGKAMDYHFEQATPEMHRTVVDHLKIGYQHAYERYEEMLAVGIAREVSRMILPVGIFSTCMVTMNLRALMNFLSLRVKADGSMFPSNPQWEINQVADHMEKNFADHFPVIHRAFVDCGRVSP